MKITPFVYCWYTSVSDIASQIGRCRFPFVHVELLRFSKAQ